MIDETLERLLQEIAHHDARGRISGARALIGQALRAAPNEPDVLCYAAALEIEDGDQEAALDLVNDALLIAPSHRNARGTRYDILRALRRLGDAEMDVLSMLEDEPGNGSLHAAYAQLAMEALQLDKAQLLLEQAARLDPDGREVLLVHALFDVATGRNSMDSTRRLVERYPDSAKTLHIVFAKLASTGRLREAQSFIEQSVRYAPDDKGVIADAKEMKVFTHWSTLPLRPLYRIGRFAQVGQWSAVVASIIVFRNANAGTLALALAALCLVYVVYSWVWPLLLRRILE